MQLTHIIVPFIAFVVNLVLTPIILYLSHRNEWYDEKNHRKVHTRDVPRLGGLGIFTAFVLALVAGAALGGGDELGNTLLRYSPAVAALLLIHIAGLIDDFTNLRAVYKLFAQLLAAFLVTLAPLRITTLWIPFTEIYISLGILSIPITMLWIVSIANAVNLIDGVDGLAGGFASIAALGTGLISFFILGNHGVSIVAFALFGALLAFLLFNLPPARIFMGDGGSLTVGFLLAAIPLGDGLSGVRLNVGEHFGVIPIATLLLLPIMDMITSIARRLRKKKPIHMADREHIHHKLIDMGMSSSKILAALYSYSVLTALSAAIWFLLPVNVGFIFIALIWLLSLVGTIRLESGSRNYSLS